jgi:hypothetical protein
MSYLNPLRLHFAGTFQAAVSTVNNDPTHFNNQTFKPEYQELQTATAANGWWNPWGAADWRLIGCKVTSAWLANGRAAGRSDPIRRYMVADSDSQVAGKLVDLDPQQQTVSEIWGLEVRICDEGGATLLRGQFEPVGFMDIWARYPPISGDGQAGAFYQSVLTGLEWGEIGQSPFLQALRDAATDGLLSIKFNVDSYNTGFTSPGFSRGRIMGTIGPAAADEPHHFVPGRQFMTTGLPSSGFFVPAGQINFCVAAVNQELGKVYLDLGNALTITRFGGPAADIGSILVVCDALPSTGQFGRRVILGEIPHTFYSSQDWYSRTAGVVELPQNRKLTADELGVIAGNPLTILLPDANGRPALAIAEPENGLYVRADDFVFRMNPGEKQETQLYATKFGRPYPNARVVSIFDPGQLQGPGPQFGVPTDALDFPSLVVTDEKGMATLTFSASDPKNPRGYIDGQMYGVRPMLEETVFVPETGYPFNQLNFISVLVWDDFQPDDPPTWYGSMQPIFQQYGNLYPVMKRFLNLWEYESICANVGFLKFAFGLDPSDPNSMPVTRDLSASKRKAILDWLNNPGPDGKPLPGTPPPATGAEGAAQAAEPEAPLPPANGGKSSAMSRRLVLNRGRR